MLNLTPIPQSMHDPIHLYVKHLRAGLGAGLDGVTVYGAIVSDAWNPARHAMQSVVMVSEVDLEALRQFAQQGLALGAAHIAAPLVMTGDYIRQSLDTFPLELLEIQQFHHTILGIDPFADLTFDPLHLRLQCERELKVMQIGMRQDLLAAAGHEEEFAGIELDLGVTLVRTLRGMLHVKGQTDPLPANHVVDEASKLVTHDLVGVRSALTITGPHGWTEFQQLYTDLDILRSTVNDW